MRKPTIPFMGIAAVVALVAATPTAVAGVEADPPGGAPGDPIELSPEGTRAGDARILSDGTVIFVSRETQWSVRNIWQSKVLGGLPTLRWEGPVSAEGVSSMLVSPDEQYVVFIADGVVPGKYELYSMPVAGGDAVKLSIPLPGDGSVGLTVISGDSDFVFYRTRENDIYNLYRVPITGGPSTQLNKPMTKAFHGVFYFRVSPDGERVVYRAKQLTGRTELYSVPSGGGTVTKLNPQGPGKIVEFELISPDSQYVAYTGSINEKKVFELFVVPIAGGESVRLSGPLVAGGDVSGFTWSPDGSRIVYRADQDTNDMHELYSTPSHVADPIKLSDGDAVGWFFVDPTGSYVLHTGAAGMMTVPIAGGDVMTISPDWSTSVDFPLFTPDGSTAIFVARGVGQARLYAAPVAGGEPTWLSKKRPDLERIWWDQLSDIILLTPDANRVLFSGDTGTDSDLELFSVRVDGSGFTTLASPNGGFPLDVSDTQVVFRSGNLMSVAVQNFWCDGERATHVGTLGRDTITGSSSPDVIVTFSGNDVVDAGDGRDTVCGGPGRDTLRGGRGADRLFGQKGADTVLGQLGLDTLDGGPRSDIVKGGAHDDDLAGGLGDDSLDGGGGDDVCDGQAGTDTAVGCEVEVGIP